MCETGASAGSSAGVDAEPIRRRCNHEWKDDQPGRQRLANMEADGGRRVHAAGDTPSKSAAKGARHCKFMCHGGVTSNSSSRVEDERDKTSRGSHRGTIGLNRCKQHSLDIIRCRTRPEVVIPENGIRRVRSESPNTTDIVPVGAASIRT